jgi:hypothetical protein
MELYMSTRKHLLVAVVTIFTSITVTCYGGGQAITNQQSESSKTLLYFNASRVYQCDRGSLELIDLGLCIGDADLEKAKIYGPGSVRMHEAELRSNSTVKNVVKKLDAIVDAIVKRRGNGQSVKLLRYQEPPGCVDYIINYAAYEHPELDITDEAIETLNKAYLERKPKK